MTQPVAGGKRRSWGKIIGLGCVGLLLFGVLAAAGVFALVTGTLKRSDPYQQAVQRAQASPSAIAALGEPIEPGWFISGSVESGGDAGEARLAIPVSGPRGEGKLHGEADKTAGQWQFTSLLLSTEGGPPIDLLAEGAPAMGGAEAGDGAAQQAAPQARPAAGAAGGGVFSVHAERKYSYADNPLYTELSLNGELVNIFTSDTWEPFPVRQGWNRVTMTTTAQDPANAENGLLFRFGPMFEEEDGSRSTMAPVLWFLRNEAGWSLEDGRYRYPLGPDVRSVTHDYELYYAGLEHERRELGAGDYVLQGNPKYSYTSAPMTATVVVNGTTLNTFTLEARQVVITPLLVEGRNEIRLISRRVPDVLAENDIQFLIAGPAEWSAGRNEWVMRPVVEFGAMQGWRRDGDTGQLVNAADPSAMVIERTIPFVLKTAPGAGG